MEITKILADGKHVEFSSAKFEDAESDIIQIWGIPSDCFKEVFTFNLFCRRGFVIEFKMDSKEFTAEADFVRGRTTVGGSNLTRLIVRDVKAA
ncbi:hypothetical protein CN613_25595 [Bacillus pseudomycoides]|uniref:Uncharacterized protein n=1 Tax=Bacillus pseudomycoides TaxID=64104 RepID=A0A2A8BYH5_9BACI|nr:hypothetical protein [Bacillus pseudomycoides]PEM65321.1 hypothetical protein CN613_25595 [Bacillus pseudomycoides]